MGSGLRRLGRPNCCSQPDLKTNGHSASALNFSEAASSAESAGMQISRLGQQAYQAAQQSLAGTADRIATKGLEPESAVDLKQAEQQAQIGAKLIEKGDDLEQSLLDILA